MNFRKIVYALLCGAMLAGFTACEKENEVDNPQQVINDPNAKVHVGVVAFNGAVYTQPITSDLNTVKNFISKQNNSIDNTAFYYAVLKGNEMFDAPSLPEFDNIFMLSFTDGRDNASSELWQNEGVQLSGTQLLPHTLEELGNRKGLNSYTMGFGEEEVKFREQLKSLTMGSGQYFSAQTATELQPAFKKIAQSVLSSAKNVVMRTTKGYFPEEEPKLFRLNFNAQKDGKSIDDVVFAKFVGQGDDYTFTVTQAGQYVTFNQPVKAQTIANNTRKVEIPLNNLKFVYNGEELKYDYLFEVYDYNTKTYSYESEESAAETSISNRIGVVLVMDCSTSLGAAFSPLQEAAIEFVETLEAMDVDENTGTTPPDNGGDNGNNSNTLSVSYGQAYYYPNYSTSVGENFQLYIGNTSNDYWSSPLVVFDIYSSSARSIVGSYSSSKGNIDLEYSEAYFTQQDMNNEVVHALTSATLKIEFDGVSDGSNVYSVTANFECEGKKYSINKQLIIDALTQNGEEWEYYALEGTSYAAAASKSWNYNFNKISLLPTIK